ncbi:MAG: hypothetical protein WBI07_14055 [Mobilitalea sp.]
MPIKPIDIMRTQEVSQIKHTDSQKAQHAQEQIGRNFQNVVKHEQKMPTQTTKTDNHEYQYDAKEKGNGNSAGNKKKGNNEKDKNTADESKDPHKSGGFNILI